MAPEGPFAPRRALGPLPDESDDAPRGARFGSRATPPEPPSPVTDTGRLRRQAAGPLSPEDLLDLPATTPVPPPLPVLPDSEAALPPAAGRRFSASAEPREVVSAAPRRSAVSASSPPSAIAPILPAVTRPTAPPPITAWPGLSGDSGRASFNRFPASVATAPTAPPDAPAMAKPQELQPTVEAPAPEPTVPTKAGLFGRRGDKPAKPAKEKTPKAPRLKRSEEKPAKASADAAKTKGRSAKPALIIISSVAAVAVLVAASVWLLTLRSIAPSGGPTEAGNASALDPLLTVADLGILGSSTWVGPGNTGDGVRPLCLASTGDGLPNTQRSVARRIGSASSPLDAVVQVVDTYPDNATATQAYAVRLAQLGTCPDVVALITGANTISGLADSADAVRVTVQEAQDQFHTLLISRTGRAVSLLDVLTVSAPVTVADVATTAAKALRRLCSADQGTCPGSIQVAAGVPSPDKLPGWLIEADLPRLTPGAGRWSATEPATALSVVGSQCEAVNLKAVSGTTATGQRTFLLADDSKAPTGFGLDQVIYTFGEETSAADLAAKLVKNISSCGGRAPTASITKGPSVKGTGVAGAKISGSTYLVSQKTETDTVVFRVAVLTVGSRVCYLLANPSTTFDFTEDAWKKLALRAGQRVSQGA